MQSFKRLIAFYHEPGNWWRLVFVFLLVLLMLANVFLTLQITYWRTPSPLQGQLTTPLDRFLAILPVLAAAGLWLFLAFFACKRASFDVPWRIRILEGLPVILLGCAAFYMHITY